MAYSTINKSSLHFNTNLYTGNGSTQHSITGVGFQPDLVWIKGRGNAYNHFLFDAVRGVGKQLYSNSVNAEGTNLNNLYSFDSDGFSLAQSGNDDVTNQNNINFASWNWYTGATASSNTDGSITSTVSANTTSGFSIVSWTGNAVTGATIGHGLGVKPNMIILKNRGPDAANWQVYHSSLGATKYLQLNSSGGVTTSNTRWNDTEPTSTVFTTGSSGDVKGDSSGETFIAYCFADKTGYSKIGSYTGNGNADGTFVYTGFKPAWVLLKNTTTGTSWTLYDNQRPGYNDDNAYLLPDTTDTELSDKAIDLLSNGFKPRTSNSALNTSGDTYIYMAFGQSLVGSNNVPCTAR